MKKMRYFLFVLFALAVTFISTDNASALQYKTWIANLKDVAYTLENKNYSFKASSSAGASSYSVLKNHASLQKKKSVPKLLNLKTNHYKLGGYCDFYSVSTKKWNNRNCSSNALNSLKNCKRCYVADCSDYCRAGKSKLGYYNCLATLNRSLKIKGKKVEAKNPYQLDKWCRDNVNRNKMAQRRNQINRTINQNNAIANANAKKLSVRNINCQSYIKYALQKSGVYKGKYLSIYGSNIESDLSCNQLKKNFDIIIPSDVNPDGKCYTKQVAWLNRYKNGNRASVAGLVNTYCDSKTKKCEKRLKNGDIISQYDGSGAHVEVFAWCTKWTNNKNTCVSRKLYGVGSQYQIVTKNFGDYGLTPGGVFSANKILNTQNDRRNNHHNPQVAMIIRIKNLK